MSNRSPVGSSTQSQGEIALSGVSKRFRKRTLARRKHYTTIKTTLVSALFQKKFPRDNYLQVLDNINLQITPGKAVGVIGRNGSGKSTLLKLIAGIYRPDVGTVRVDGRISALIELGAGFHPDFTGRENIFLGGVMYGLSKKEIEARFDSIVDFAQLRDCIDDPVRTYSSGMYMRLGFSLAVHTDPDILLIDEVLAVGDAAFIHRCHDTISDFKRRGKTLLFVTHDLDAVVRWCDEAVWLDRGIIRQRGEPQCVVDRYLQSVEESESTELNEVNARTTPRMGPAGADSRRWGNRDVEILSVRMLGADGQPRWLFHDEDSVIVEVDYRIHQPVEELVFGVGILRADGLCIHGTNTDRDGVIISTPAVLNSTHEVSGTYRYHIERIALTEGSYFFDVAAHRKDGFPYDYHHRMHQFSVRSAVKRVGLFSPKSYWEIVPVDGRTLRQGVAGS